MVRFSVVIPTFDREKYLSQAILSAAGQSVSPEIIVVDDGSTDRTSHLVRTLGVPGLRYVYKDNGGVASALNRGIELARGDYVIPLGSDDALVPGILEAYAAMVRNRPELDVLYGNLVLTDETLKPRGVWNYEDWDGRNAELVSRLTGNCTLAQSGSAFHRRVYDRFGGYDESLSRASDHDHLSRIAADACFKHAGAPSLLCREHDSNISRNTRAFRRCKARVIRRVLNRHGLWKLYPDKPWQQDEPRARMEAAVEAANVLAAYDDREEALRLLRTVGIEPEQVEFGGHS